MNRNEILPNAIKRVAQIIKREEAEGRGIPSTEILANECGVSRGTVERALRKLRDDGVISVKRRTTVPTAGFPYIDDQERDANLRQASALLLEAIRREHPERLAA